MGSQPSDLDFALIGHTESWRQVRRMMDALRRPGLPPIDDATLRDTYPWIPPRTIERLTVRSHPGNKQARGIYVESFIPPDSLGPENAHRNIDRVISAVQCAEREGAPLAALGGFTSILLRRYGGSVRLPDNILLTTGNSLAAAFIVKGVERAAGLRRVPLDRATLLIVGSTGDLGSACASYFAPKVERLLLSARTRQSLRRQIEELSEISPTPPVTGTLRSLLPLADIVIAVAGLAAPALSLNHCKPDVLVCDAGYPKNTGNTIGVSPGHLFWGGMGRVLGGWQGQTNVSEMAYQFPHPGIAHGCFLEGMALGLEGRCEAYSLGRGGITPERIEEIFSIAGRHGIVPAPFFNQHGLWPDQAGEV